MKKRKKRSRRPKQRVQSASIRTLRTKLFNFWHPIPFDKKDNCIPSSVDCIYNMEYYGREQAKLMLTSL